MTGKHPPPIGGRTLADDLRDKLSQVETWVHQIGARDRYVKVAGDAGRSGIELMQLLDRIADELERLEQRGVDLRAERGRFESVLSQLGGRRKALVAHSGKAMAVERPADARWWWYLDEQVAAGRRRKIVRAIVTTLIGLAALAVLYLLYDRYLAPPSHIRQAYTHFSQGERAAFEGDLEQAIEQFETVVRLDQEDAKAHLWLGVLYQLIGQIDQAADSSEKAQALYGDNEIGFLFERGTLYMFLGDAATARQDARSIIERHPERPEGYFLNGSIAEQARDWNLAAESFERASAAAEESGQIALQVTARMRLATVLQQQIAQPSQ